MTMESVWPQYCYSEKISDPGKILRTKTGEIDLIASFKSRIIVFVEVKAWRITSGTGQVPRTELTRKNKKRSQIPPYAITNSIGFGELQDGRMSSRLFKMDPAVDPCSATLKMHSKLLANFKCLVE